MEQAQRILGSLRRILHTVDRNNQRICKTVGLTTAQLTCLRELSSAGELAIGELAKRVGSSGTTLTGVIDRMEAKGLVQRTRSPRDRRSVRLTLTEKGRASLSELPIATLDPFFESLKALSDADVARLDVALHHIAERMQAPASAGFPIVEELRPKVKDDRSKEPV